MPYYIPFDYVVRAAVVNEDAENRLKATGFNREIIVEPRVFF